MMQMTPDFVIQYGTVDWSIVGMVSKTPILLYMNVSDKNSYDKFYMLRQNFLDTDEIK